MIIWIDYNDPGLLGLFSSSTMGSNVNFALQFHMVQPNNARSDWSPANMSGSLNHERLFAFLSAAKGNLGWFYMHLPFHSAFLCRCCSLEAVEQRLWTIEVAETEACSRAPCIAFLTPTRCACLWPHSSCLLHSSNPSKFSAILILCCSDNAIGGVKRGHIAQHRYYSRRKERTISGNKTY